MISNISQEHRGKVIITLGPPPGLTTATHGVFFTPLITTLGCRAGVHPRVQLVEFLKIEHSHTMKDPTVPGSLQAPLHTTTTICLLKGDTKPTLPSHAAWAPSAPHVME